MVTATVMENMEKATIPSKHFFVLMAAIALIAVACGGGQNLSQTLRTEADAAFASGNYALSFQKYNELISNNVELDSVASRQMSISANRLNEHELAYQYGTKYQISTGDTMLIFAVAESADSLGRTASSIELIEQYQPEFEAKYGSDFIVNKLALYYATNLNSKLCDYYGKVNDASVRSECFNAYFDMRKDSLSIAAQQKLCKEALKDNAKQEKALFVLARTKYDSAEEQYKVTMADYNKKKNATTYAYLRRDLKRISAVYVESKGYFEQLRKISEENKTYIKYLININLRLDQPEKAKALEKLL